MKKLFIVLSIVLFNGLFSSCTNEMLDEAPVTNQSVLQADSDWNGDDVDDDDEDDEDEDDDDKTDD